MEEIEEVSSKLTDLYAKQMKYMQKLDQLFEDVPKKKIKTVITPVFVREVPPRKLAKLLGIDRDKEIAKIDVGRKLILYCKQHNLISQSVIKCNEPLKSIFDEDTIEIYRIQYYLDAFYLENKANKND